MPRSEVQNAHVREVRAIQILQAALTVYVRQGYHGADMNDVAAEAGLAKGLLYYYYGTKQGLFQALFTWALGEGAALYRGIAEGTKALPPAKALVVFAMDVYRQARRDPRIVQFSMRLPFDAAAVWGQGAWPEGAERSEEHMRLLAALIDRALAEKGLPRGEAPFLAQCFWAVFVSSIFSFTKMIGNAADGGSCPSLEDGFLRVARFAFQGLGLRGDDWEPHARAMAAAGEVTT